MSKTLLFHTLLPGVKDRAKGRRSRRVRRQVWKPHHALNPSRQMFSKLLRSMSAAAASPETESLFISKFGNLSVGGRGGETNTGVEAGSASGEADDVFKSMDAECKVCMQEIKVRHQVACAT